MFPGSEDGMWAELEQPAAVPASVQMQPVQMSAEEQKFWEPLRWLLQLQQCGSDSYQSDSDSCLRASSA